MIIEQNFPYKHCDSCPQCILDVKEKELYVDNKILTRNITISCKNAWLCEQLKTMIKEEQNNVGTETD